MNIAIQIGGELRNWETSYTLFKVYKKTLEKYNIDVDYYGCFWNSEYTSYCQEQNLFDIFTACTFLPVPSIGVTQGRKKNMNYNNTGKSLTLYNWAYSLYLSTKLRRRHQWEAKSFGFKYDFVVFTRPDVYIPFGYWDSLHRILEKSKKYPFPYTLFVPPVAKTVIEAEGFPRWANCFAEDIKVSGDEDGMNVFGFGILPMYIDKNPSFVATYHNTPCLIMSKFNLGIVPTSESFKSDWHILRCNDCITVDGHIDIEKPYLEYEDIHNMKIFLKEKGLKYEV